MYIVYTAKRIREMHTVVLLYSYVNKIFQTSNGIKYPCGDKLYGQDTKVGDLQRFKMAIINFYVYITKFVAPPKIVVSQI